MTTAPQLQRVDHDSAVQSIFPAKSPSQQVSPGAENPQSGLVQARLTTNNLWLLDEMTRHERTPTPTARGSTSRPTTVAVRGAVQASKLSISTATAGFAANGVLDQKDSKPPVNINNLYETLDRARKSPSPTPADFAKHVDAVDDAPNGATILYESNLLKEYDDKGYVRVFNQAFTAFPQDLGFNRGLSAPQPGMVEGLKQQEFKPFLAREELGGAAVLIRDFVSSVTLPHIAGEWKGPGENIQQAAVQGAINGAHLVYGRNRALDHLDTPEDAGHAAVTTFTTNGTTLNTFAHHAALSETVEGRTDYHTYPITSTNLTLSFEEFKKGRRQLRNLQDFARDQSYSLRDKLKEHWETKPSGICTLPDEDAPPAPSRLSTFGTPESDARAILTVPEDYKLALAARGDITSAPRTSLPVPKYMSHASSNSTSMYQHRPPAAAQPVLTKAHLANISVISISDDDDDDDDDCCEILDPKAGFQTVRTKTFVPGSKPWQPAKPGSFVESFPRPCKG